MSSLWGGLQRKAAWLGSIVARGDQAQVGTSEDWGLDVSGFAAAADFGGMFLPGPIVLYLAPSKAPAVRAPAPSKALSVHAPAPSKAPAAVPAPGSSKAPAVGPKPAPSEAPAAPEPVPRPAPSETASPVVGGTAPVTTVQAAQEETRAVTDPRKGLLENIKANLALIAAQREQASGQPLAQNLIDVMLEVAEAKTALQHLKRVAKHRRAQVEKQAAHIDEVKRDLQASRAEAKRLQKVNSALQATLADVTALRELEDLPSSVLGEAAAFSGVFMMPSIDAVRAEREREAARAQRVRGAAAAKDGDQHQLKGRQRAISIQVVASGSVPADGADALEVEHLKERLDRLSGLVWSVAIVAGHAETVEKEEVNEKVEELSVWHAEHKKVVDYVQEQGWDSTLQQQAVESFELHRDLEAARTAVTTLRWEHAQLRAALGNQGFWGAVAELDAPAEGDDAGRQSVSAATSQEELIGSEGIAKQTNQSALSSRGPTVQPGWAERISRLLESVVGWPGPVHLNLGDELLPGGLARAAGDVGLQDLVHIDGSFYEVAGCQQELGAGMTGRVSVAYKWDSKAKTLHKVAQKRMVVPATQEADKFFVRVRREFSSQEVAHRVVVKGVKGGHVPACLGLVEQPDEHCARLFMQVVPGQDLQAALDERFGSDRTCQEYRDVAMAITDTTRRFMAGIHAEGVAWTDCKAANMMVRSLELTEDKTCLKHGVTFLDFGGATSTQDGASALDTALTVAYSSPMVVIEMLFDANPLAEPSKYAWARYDPVTQDLWTLGELLFSLLFGRPACFSLEGMTSQHKCLAKQLNKQLEWVTQLDAGRSPPQLLQEVAGKACQQWTSRVADRLRECWHLPDRNKQILAAFVKRTNKIDARHPHVT